ncbi:hypothetical protein ACWEKM_35205 [Streptomyces sp. NPDC004752]
MLVGKIGEVLGGCLFVFAELVPGLLSISSAPPFSAVNGRFITVC